MVNITTFMYKTFFKGTSGMILGMCLSLFLADMVYNRGINYLWAQQNKGMLFEDIYPKFAKAKDNNVNTEN